MEFFECIIILENRCFDILNIFYKGNNLINVEYIFMVLLFFKYSFSFGDSVLLWDRYLKYNYKLD